MDINNINYIWIAWSILEIIIKSKEISKISMSELENEAYLNIYIHKKKYKKKTTNRGLTKHVQNTPNSLNMPIYVNISPFLET